MARPRWFAQWRLTQALDKLRAHKQHCERCREQIICFDRDKLVRSIKDLQKVVRV